MLLFLYGEDTFRSREKLNQIKAKFRKKDQPGLNISVFREEVDFLEFKKAAQGAAFLGRTRLVILENILQNKKEIVSRVTDFLAERQGALSNIIVFWEGGVPDKRSRLFKLLARISQKEEFPSLFGYGLNQWVQKRILEKGGAITPEALKELILRVGNNLHQMENDIDKLLAYKKKKKIEIEDVRVLVKAKLENDIFKLVDTLSHKDRPNALKFVQDQINLGANELYILAMIIYAFRNLIIVKDLAEKGLPRQAIISQTKLHPFVVQKTLACLSRFNLEELKKIYEKLLDLDIKIKTGRVNPDFGLTMLIMGVTA